MLDKEIPLKGRGTQSKDIHVVIDTIGLDLFVKMLLRLVDAVVVPISVAMLTRLAWDMLAIDPYMVCVIYYSTD